MKPLVVATVATVALSVLASGCLDPLVEDDPPLARFVLPPGSTVPSIDDDTVLSRQLASNDGVGDIVPLLSGFAEGAAVSYWDFGPVPTSAEPVYVLGRFTDGGFERVDHNTIIDVIPGDAGYTPYWTVYTIEVTSAYNGELVVSAEGIDEAERMGLVRAPIVQPFAVNCPAVSSDVRVDVGGDTVGPNATFYWRGVTVPYFDFGVMPVTGTSRVPVAPMYQLRREGSEPLSEPVRGIDMTGDGDIFDTNNLFGHGAGDETSPLCQTVEIVVPSTYGSIDTYADDTAADFKTATDVVDGEPVAGAVIAIEATEDFRNCVMQREPGGL
jgi:hypothetical protein